MTTTQGDAGFGGLVRSRRQVLRLTLRKFAERAGMDPGNVSRIERGRAQPPQDLSILGRMADALEWPPKSNGRQQLVDLAATENGKIPEYVMSDKEVMESLPVLFRTLHGKKMTPEQLDRLIKAIKQA